MSYNDEDSLKYYRDLKNSLDTAYEEGIEQGIEKVARQMLKNNVPIKKIAQYTGLTLSQVKKLKQDV